MTSMPRSYFDEMYRCDPDPWQFESSWYEQRKYELTVAALPERRYRSAFEPGCSVGVLSSLLAATMRSTPGYRHRSRRGPASTGSLSELLWGAGRGTGNS